MENHQRFFDVNDPMLIKNLWVWGMVFMAVSVLYLLAANWFWFAKAVQLAIPQLLLMMTAFASTASHISNTAKMVLQTISGLMMGLSLAMIGQVYQTGADSYQLFGLWSLLLMGWFYQKNIGIFTLFWVTSQLTLWLFFQQMSFSHQMLYAMLSWNVLSLLQFGIMVKFYPVLRFLFIGLFALISLVSALLLKEFTLIYAISLVLTPLVAFVYYQKQQDELATSLSLSVLAMGLSVWFLITINSLDNFDRWLLRDILVLLWFLAVAWWLLRLFPKGKFHKIPLILGAWLVGMNVSLMFLVFWEKISMLLGLVALIGSILAQQKLKSSSQPHDFLKQLIYCLLIFGQSTFLIHLAIQTEKVFWVVVAQIIINLVMFWLRPHWFLLYLQTFCSYLLLNIYLLEFQTNFNQSVYLSYDVLLVKGLFLSTVFALPVAQKYGYQRGIWLLVLSVLLTTKIFSFYIMKESEMFILSMVFSKWLMIGLCLAVIWRYLSLKSIQAFGLAMLAVWVGYLGHDELFWLFMGLVFALSTKDKLLYGLYISSFAGFLWVLYYSLELTLLAKSMSIFLSGLMFILLAKVFNCRPMVANFGVD